MTVELLDRLPDRPLRIGLLIDDFNQPRWVTSLIEDITTSSIAQIVLVIKNRMPSPSRPDRLRRVWAERGHLLYAFYTRLDRWLFRVEPDAFEETDAEPLLAHCPVLTVEPIRTKYRDALSEPDLAAIRLYELDVALRFGFRILTGGVLKIATYGVWSYHHADNWVNRGGPAGFWETMRGDPVTGSVLQILTEELDHGKVIYRSWAATLSRFSVRRNTNNYYWKSAAFVMRKLNELASEGSRALASDGAESVYRPYARLLYRRPNNAEMTRLLLRLFARGVGRLYGRAVSREQWCLAYRFHSGPADPNGTLYRFLYAVPPKDRFWADPFPVRVQDTYFVFVEEWIYRRRKGHIAVLELSRDRPPSGAVKVLEMDYHLSYPFVFEWGGRFYMVPETSANRTVELYRCTAFPDRWELATVLLKDCNAVDATLAEIEGRWWMFVNIDVDGAVSRDELHLFYADTPLGPWTPHRRNPVKSDVRSARSAGRLFTWNGALYRPAQDCSKRYGYSVSINQVTRITPAKFREKEVSSLLPEWDSRVLGTHTLNSVGALTVVDCLRRRRRVF